MEGRKHPLLAAAVAVAVAALACVLWGCGANIPETRYGVDKVEFHGVEKVTEDRLAANLITHERPSFLFWRWPWTDWPLFDADSFQRDLLRIVRWYRARGFYDARVTKYEVTPPAAAENDLLAPGKAPCEREDDDEGCRVAVSVTVDEGKAVHVKSIRIKGDRKLPTDVREQLLSSISMKEGQRFDEAEYDAAKAILERRLANNSYAHAKVTGEVTIDQRKRRAAITFIVDSGPACRYGDITVEGNAGLDKAPILGASYLNKGDPFSAADLAEAQRAIFALGVFASVDVDPTITPDDDQNAVIPVVIRVTPGRLFRAGLGGGIQIGTFNYNGQVQDANQWDVHAVLPFLEFRNFLGGLRKLRIEERPRLIMPVIFPAVTTPRFGNEVRLEFKQPAFIEPRTTLVLGARWDYGPDPNIIREKDLFFRHDFDAILGPERTFFDGKLFVALKVHANLYVPDEANTPLPDVVAPGATIPSEFHTMAFEETINVDLRDNSQTPRSGAYFGFHFTQGGFFLPSSWNFVRVVPEARGYLPLPARLVLAARFGVGATWVSEPDSSLHPLDQRLGPRGYRFRLGGASTNRGYLPSRVGGSEDGGTRQWFGSVELRLRAGDIWGVVLFADMGDADSSESPSFRFNYLHLSMGGGFRLYTPVGPLRIDLGFQVPGAQVFNAPAATEESEPLGISAWRFAGALNITIGEAF